VKPSTATSILALTAAYFVAGQLGLLLAIPQGFASPVWPASGIALGALLVYGNRLWPGVLLGSLLVEWSLHGNLSTFTRDPANLLLPTVIGSGAALQALLGAHLIRRALGFPVPLDDGRSVGAFLLLGGPLACLLNATLSSSSLWVADRLTSDGYSLAWATWWVGDTIGVLVFTPLVLIGVAQPRTVWAHRTYTVGLPLCVAFAMSAAVFYFAGDSERRRVESGFQRHATIMAETLRRTIDANIGAVNSIVRFFDSSQKVERQEFATFVGDRVGPRHGIRALEWVPRVRHQDRTALAARAREDGLQSFRITEQGPDGKLVEAADREEYYPVYFVEPVAGNKPALGFDLASDPTRRAALEMARDSGKAISSARINLIQEAKRPYGVLVFSPVYGRGAKLDSREARRRAVLGFALGVFNVAEIIDAALPVPNRGNVKLRLTDRSSPSGQTLLFADTTDREGTAISNRIRSVFDLEVAGRTWSLEISPTDAYFADQRSLGVWSVLAGALLFTGLLGAFLLMVTGEAIKTQRLVDERTKELLVSQDRFRDFAESTSDWVWETDSGHRFTYLSDRLLEATGGQAVRMEGQTLMEVAGDAADEKWRAHWDLMKAQKPFRNFQFRYETATQPDLWFSISGRPIYDFNGNFTGYRGTGTDVTSQVYAEMRAKLVESELRQSEEQFRSAFETSAAGMAIHSIDGRYLKVNQTFCDIMGYSADELMDKNWRDLTYPDDVEKTEGLDEKAAAGEFENFVIEKRYVRKDGAVVWARVASALLRDPERTPKFILGQIFDITDRVLAQTALLESEERFRQFAEIASDWFWEMDADLRYTFVSDTYSKIAGKDQKAVLGRTRREMYTGYIPEERESWKDFLKRLDRHEDFDGFTYSYIRPDGQRRVFSNNGRAVFDSNSQFVGYRGTGVDVTELKRNEALLVGRNQVLGELALGESLDTVLTHLVKVADDADPEMMCAVLSRDDEAERLRLVAAPRLPEALRQALDGQEIEHGEGPWVSNGAIHERRIFENVLVDEDWAGLREAVNETDIRACWSQPIVGGETGRVLGIFAAFLNESRSPGPGKSEILETSAQLAAIAIERKRAEKEIEGQRDELAVLNEEKDKFFSIIAHDMKSPFTALLGLSTILAEKAGTFPKDEVVQYASLIRRAADQAFKLLEDLLDWSRLQLGRMEYSPQVIDVSEVIQTNMVRFQPVAELKQIDIEGKAESGTVATADLHMVDTILRNLISNAIKFTAGGGKVTIDAKANGKWTEVSVTDEGVGIEAERVKSLFDLGEKTSTNGTDGETGSGLGLQLCKELVERHGGEMSVESTQRKGTTFRFTLPSGKGR